MAKDSKTVIIGLDGVPFGMLKNFAQIGVMPNAAELISRGAFTKVNSTIPEVSSVAWPSIITGENPAQHGIFGFTDLLAGSYKMRFPNFGDLKARPFWDQCEGKSVIINVPSTYPVREMNGVHISGFVSIEMEKSVHPKSLIPMLSRMDYRLDVDSQKAHTSMDMFLADLDETLEARIQAYRYLWDNHDWQTFMLVFTGTDRLMHFLWDAYEDQGHKYHDVFLEHFRKVDSVIGQISGRIDDGDSLIMLSDHGFEKLDHDVYVNYPLIQAGLLQFKQGTENTLANLSEGTKAFALDPARIYLNLKGKYPCGSVEPDEAEQLLAQLEAIFRDLQIGGRAVIKDVYRAEQIYSGPCFDDGPDMVLVGAEGFNLKSGLKSKQLADKAIFTGKHTYQDAFLLTNNKNILPDFDNQPSVIDVGKLIKSVVSDS